MIEREAKAFAAPFAPAPSTTMPATRDDFPVEWADPSEAELEWTWDDMHCPQPLTPLAGDYMTEILVKGINYLYNHAGVPMRSYARIFNGYAYFAEEVSVPDDQVPAVEEAAKQKWQQMSRELRDYWDNMVLPALQASYEWMRTAPVETAPLPEIAAAWQRLWREATHVWDLHFLVVAGAYQALDDLSDLYEALIEEAQPSDALMLVQGSSADLHRVQRDLYLLSERARSYPAVSASILAGGDLSPDDLASAYGGPEFLQTLQSFLDDHGHLGQLFDDLAYPSWADEPSLVIAEIRKRLQQPDEDPETQRLRLRAQAAERVAVVRERLKGRPDDLARFDAVLALAQDVGPLSEDHNYMMDRKLHALAHRFALRVGGCLVGAGALAEPGDVFYLHVHEVEHALGDPGDMRSLVSERKAQLESRRSLTPPKNIGKAPSPSSVPNRFSPGAEEQSEAGILKGTAASAGVGRGPARVVLSLDEFERVQPGDVLVCPASNPSWVPLFGIIAGLVTNTGGVLAHAAVTAREFGVPAVVGTGKATTAIKDGQMVEVDGAEGVVRILS